MPRTHHVKSGQTLDSIGQPDFGWKDIAMHNWGTANPRKINWHLYHDVGCRKPRDPADPFDKFTNYRFSDDDHKYGSGTVEIPDPPTPATAVPAPAPPAALAVPGGAGGGAGAVVTFTYSRGDVLLRAGTEAWIQDITGGPYSHAGVTIDEATEMAADAHPADPGHSPHHSAGHEVNKVEIKSFFSVAHAPGGGDVYRYTGDKNDALKAALWAEGECGKPYDFDIMDPILGPTGKLENNNALYCSEFVWRSYKMGAGIELVKVKDFINLLSEENIDKTIEALTPIAREQEDVGWYVPDFVVRMKIKEQIMKVHNGYFISPTQLADSALTKKIHSIRGGAKVKSSSKKS
jgi:hypothetical protein